MGFIAHFSADLDPGKMKDFQQWLAANEQAIADSHPAGAKYLGTYVAIYADRDAGDVHTFVELDNYGTQDALAAAGNDPNSEYGRLINEYVSFIDQQSNNGTNALYNRVTDATLYGDG